LKIVRTNEIKTPLVSGNAFTGRAFGQTFSNAGTAEGNIYVNNVMLEPGARTWWHKHDFGQVIFVSAGLGLVGNEGGEGGLLQPGDLVIVPPGEWHWHGAMPAQFLMHLTVNPGNFESTVYRGDEVTDAAYQDAVSRWGGEHA